MARLAYSFHCGETRSTTSSTAEFSSSTAIHAIHAAVSSARQSHGSGSAAHRAKWTAPAYISWRNADSRRNAAANPAAEFFAALSADYAEGLTLLGGEPFEPENQRALLPFVREAKRLFPSKSVWAYTGYVYDRDIAPPGGRAHCEVTDELLSFVDVLVDGPFVESLKNISLRFRGSSNQRFLELHAPGGVKDATERYSPSDGRRA